MRAIKRTPLQSDIIDFINQYIQDNNLKSGDKLPSQEHLVEMMGVSRPSLREAVKTLEAKNILEVVNGKGIFLKDKSPNIISAQVEFGREKESILELIEARRVLERGILHLVIQNAKDEELDEIERILNVIMDKYNKGQKQNIEDRQFHLAIYNSCHNRIMQQLILSIDSTFAKLWDFPLGMQDPFTDTMPLHKSLFDSIRERNERKALSINDKILNMIYKEVKTAKDNI